MTFGQKIAYARKQKKITQADLRKAVGISGDIIGKYEREEIKPSIDVASKIADALTITIDYLVKDAQYRTLTTKPSSGSSSWKNFPSKTRLTRSRSWMPSSLKINYNLYCISSY